MFYKLRATALAMLCISVVTGCATYQARDASMQTRAYAVAVDADALLWAIAEYAERPEADPGIKAKLKEIVPAVPPSVVLLRDVADGVPQAFCWGEGEPPDFIAEGLADAACERDVGAMLVLTRNLLLALQGLLNEGHSP